MLLFYVHRNYAFSTVCLLYRYTLYRVIAQHLNVMETIKIVSALAILILVTICVYYIIVFVLYHVHKERGC